MSMGEAHFRTLTPAKPLNQFRCHELRELMCKIWLESIPAVTDLRMREKNMFCVDLFINISVSLSVSSSGLQVTVLGRF